ncbi:MAG: peptidyl-tRNA hydrolase [Candidatus Hodarchaeales archaeon]|jgi:PTH2 family peptidyl-tRNA hydrolase
MKIERELFSLIQEPPEWFLLRHLDIKRKIIKQLNNYEALDKQYSSGSWVMTFLWGKEYLTLEELLDHIRTTIFQDSELSEPEKTLILTQLKRNIKKILKNGVNIVKGNNLFKLDSNLESISNQQFIEQLLSLRLIVENFVKINYPEQIKDPNHNILDFLKYNTFLLVKTKRLLKISPLSIFIITRGDLKIGKGKLGAQIAHGMVSLMFKPHRRLEYHNQVLQEQYPDLEIYSARNVNVLLEMEKEAQKLELNESLIADAGHTQVESGTRTVLALGPAPKFYLERFIEQWENVKKIK